MERFCVKIDARRTIRRDLPRSHKGDYIFDKPCAPERFLYLGRS